MVSFRFDINIFHSDLVEGLDIPHQQFFFCHRRPPSCRSPLPRCPSSHGPCQSSPCALIARSSSRAPNLGAHHEAVAETSWWSMSWCVDANQKVKQPWWESSYELLDVSILDGVMISCNGSNTISGRYVCLHKYIHTHSTIFSQCGAHPIR